MQMGDRGRLRAQGVPYMKICGHHPTTLGQQSRDFSKVQWVTGTLRHDPYTEHCKWFFVLYKNMLPFHTGERGRIGGARLVQRANIQGTHGNLRVEGGKPFQYASPFWVWQPRNPAAHTVGMET